VTNLTPKTKNAYCPEPLNPSWVLNLTAEFAEGAEDLQRSLRKPQHESLDAIFQDAHMEVHEQADL